MDTQKRKYKKHKKGYVVSVTYFLKKDKNLIEKLFSKDKVGEAPKFPVYIRVAFLQQTVGIHSRLNVRLTENEFENYFQRQDVKDFVDIEKAVILRSVEEFKPEMIENLSISQWTKYYNEDNVELKECAEKVIVERFRADTNPHKENEANSEDLIFNLLTASLPIINKLSDMGFDKAQSYCKKYKAIFEIDNYNKAILETAEFTLWHWKLGFYQDAIRRTHGRKSDRLLNVLTELMDSYQPESN